MHPSNEHWKHFLKIRGEWGVRGICSNSVMVSFMEMEMSSTLTDKERNKIYERTALKKLQKKTSVADTVVF